MKRGRRNTRLNAKNAVELTLVKTSVFLLHSTYFFQCRMIEIKIR